MLKRKIRWGYFHNGISSAIHYKTVLLSFLLKFYDSCFSNFCFIRNYYSTIFRLVGKSLLNDIIAKCSLETREGEMPLVWLIELTAYIAPLLSLVATIIFVVQVVIRFLERDDHYSVLISVLSILIYAGAGWGCYIVYVRTGSQAYMNIGNLTQWGFLIAVGGHALFGLWDRKENFRRKRRQPRVPPKEEHTGADPKL